MQKLIQILWGIFLFTFSFSIRFLVYEQNSYRFGNFNPWVTAFIYLPEILLIITYLVYIYWKIKSGKREAGGGKLSTYRVLLFITFLANGYFITLIKGDSMLAAFWLLRIMEVGMVIQLVRAKILPIKKMINQLLYGAVFQILIGFFQWNLNESIGLKWLGESALSPEIKGVAKINLKNGLKQIRAYGTFLHPNILATYVIILFFLAWDFLNKKQRWIYYLFFTLGLLFSRSHAAFLVGAIGLFLVAFNQNIQQKISYLLLGILVISNLVLFFNPNIVQKEDLSITERQQQIVISKNMAFNQPFGVGLNHFTLKMENYSNKKLAPWDFQPVHNVYYLILNELGIQGLILLFALITLFISMTGNSVVLTLLLIIASFDHLLWTSWVGLILIGLIIGRHYYAIEPDTF